MKTLIKAIALSFIFIVNTQASLLDDLPEIKYESFTLDNGLTVVVHEDRKVPMVAVNVWYHVGSKNEKVGKTGFAHLFEHLMFNGTENYNSEYFEPFEKIGSTDQNGTTNSDRTNYFQNVPTNAVDLALWMESDRMGHLLGVVDQEKLDEQRGVVQMKSVKVKTDHMKKHLLEFRSRFSKRPSLLMDNDRINGRFRCCIP